MLALSGLGLSLGCSSSPKPSPPPSVVPIVQPNTPAPDQAADAPPAEDPAVTESREEPDDSVVVIDPGGSPDPSGTRLSDLAAAERNRRLTTDAPVLVITDDNLAEHAEGGKLTFADRPASDPSQPDSGDYSAQRQQQEAYWRQRVLETRKQWAGKVEEIFTLEARANQLRIQFYDADDPFYRDARIKPEWDRTLDNLSTARKDAKALEEKVAQIVSEGNRAGALPGWLREGIELEPKERPYDAEGNAPEPPQSTEPDLVEENP